MKNVLLFFAGLLFCIPMQAQQHKKYALKTLEKLCAPDMHGRGYVNGGDSIAACFIADELKKAGVQPVGKGYFQPFSFGVNTFPGRMMLKVGDKVLKPGYEYLVESNSGGGKATRKVFKLTKAILEEGASIQSLKDESFVKEHIAVLYADGIEDKKQQQEFFALKYELARVMPVVVVSPEHVIWSVGRTAFPYPIFEVEAEFWDAEAMEVAYDVEQVFIEKHTTRNVIGIIPGTDKKKKKEYVLFTGHYDHLGRMGSEAYFPGANDNASGITMLLSLANHYAQHPPEYSVVIIAFAGEEAGLLGSEYFADHPMVKMNKIRMVVNLDILGTGDDGITVVNGTVYKDEFKLMQDINSEKDYLAQVKVRGETRNSDHYHFHRNGVPAFFIYTMGGIGHYHNVLDKSETLPLTEFEDLMHLLIDFTDRL